MAVVASSSCALDRSALPFRSKTPRSDVSWSIDFRNDLDCIKASDPDEFLNVVNSVDLFGAVLAVLGEFWVRAELDWEGLIVDDVPVEDVQFRERHGFDDALDGSDAQEVSGRVDHDTSVLEQWLILDDGMRDLVVLDDLRERLQSIDIA